jgi:hypothetical protein
MKMGRVVRVTFIKLMALSAILLLVSVTIPGMVGGTSTGRGFSTHDNSLIIGMAASLNRDSTADNQFIEAADRDNKDLFVGIVTTKESNSLTLSTTGSNIFVTSEGEANGLASDINGAIKKGDHLTTSALKGIVMKADNDENAVIGTALQDFSISDARTQVVNDPKGKPHDVKINKLSVEVNVRNDLSNKQSQKPFLLLFGQSVTGKQVNQWQVIAALLIFFLILVVEGSVIYGATHSSIEAIGRNPLASKAVHRQTLQIFITMLIVLFFGVIIIYAVLWS